MRKILATRKASAKVGGEGGSGSPLLDVRSGGEAASFGIARGAADPPSLHEITSAFFQPGALPAALVRGGRAVSLSLAQGLRRLPIASETSRAHRRQSLRSSTSSPKPSPIRRSPHRHPSRPYRQSRRRPRKLRRLPKTSPTPKPTPALKPDAELDNVADEFIRGYLAARPLHATALGFHEYDGRISEYTRLAIDAELARLRRFDDRLNKFDLAKLGPRAAIDLRLLQAAIKKELFLAHDLAIYEHNPMIYASAIDVNVYVKRKYAPIEDRVRSIIVVENQAPNIMIAAKTNLADVLPKPYVELAIQIARGSSDFLKKNLVDALADLKDDNLRATFMQSNRRAATALADYAAWLEKEKLPKATPQFAIGEEKYQRFLAQTELVDLPPAKILELGIGGIETRTGGFRRGREENRRGQTGARGLQANPERTSRLPRS